jgi:hypothetical protein
MTTTPGDRPQSGRGGVTAAFTGFLCALTPFLTSRDLRAVEQVSRLDRAMTRDLWAMCAQKIDKAPSGTLMRVLRHECLSWCGAYAWNVARTYLRNHLQSLECEPMNLGIDPPNKGTSPMWVQLQVAPSCASNEEFFLSLQWRFTRKGLQGPGAVLCDDYAAHIAPDARRQTSVTLDKCTTYLLHVLVHFGLCDAGINYAFVNSREESEWIIAIWFHLGVAPVLPLQHRYDVATNRFTEGTQYQRHHAHIQLEKA